MPLLFLLCLVLAYFDMFNVFLEWCDSAVLMVAISGQWMPGLDVFKRNQRERKETASKWGEGPVGHNCVAVSWRLGCVFLFCFTFVGALYLWCYLWPESGILFGQTVLKEWFSHGESWREWDRLCFINHVSSGSDLGFWDFQLSKLSPLVQAALEDWLRESKSVRGRWRKPLRS